MPEARGGPQRWRLLGRFLPREVRERIFEPAFSDLMYRWLTSPGHDRRLPFSLHALGVYLGCTPIATARLFFRNRRLTRFGRYSLWAVGGAATVLLVAVQVLRSYGSYR